MESFKMPQTSFKALMSLMLSLLIWFQLQTGSEAASYTRHSVDQFLSDHAEVITMLAHPSTEYVSKTLLGNRQMKLYFRSPWSGKVLEMVVRVDLDSQGNFNNIAVVSDQAALPAFVATTVGKEFVSYLLKEYSNSPELSYNQTQTLKYLANQVQHLSGQQISNLLLKFYWH